MKVDGLGQPGMINSIAGKEAKNASPTSSFGDMLKEALNQVDGMQNTAQEKAKELMSGDTSQIQSTVIAYEQAYLALQLTMQVRNKVIEAYHEIMRITM
ncbi:MAG: flagellar hook-basal body complex protein FliE [Candidatus Saccharibacteria bacterium]